MVVSLPLHAYAAGKLGDAMAKLRPLGDAAGASGGDIQGTFGTIINAALSLIGTIFFLLMIYAGFLWMTARGDEGQIDKSKQIISGTIIGLVLVVSAYAITVFVTGRFETSGPTSDATSGAVGCCVSCTRGGASSECTRVWGVTRSACENLDTQTPSGSCDGTLTCTLDTGILQTDCH
jgi:cbb3-type cytochrome oxidase subunit 3